MCTEDFGEGDSTSWIRTQVWVHNVALCPGCIVYKVWALDLSFFIYILENIVLLTNCAY
jgi:hypothetical protein